jgi:hypothetical protein
MSPDTKGATTTTTTEKLSVDLTYGREILPLLQLFVQTLMSIQNPIQYQSGAIFPGLVW